MNSEYKNLLKYFPKLKLCYEKRFHSKVYNTEYYITVPYGKKYFAWFRNFYGRNTLYIMEINKKTNRIINIEKSVACFHNDLCIGDGTIFYGAIVNYGAGKFFNIEDLLMSCGDNYTSKQHTNLVKLRELYSILENKINQVGYSKNCIVFGLPIMTNNINKIGDMIYNCPYKIYSIQHRFLTKKVGTFYNQTIDHFNIYANFIITSDIRPDTYNLYLLHNHKRVYHGNCLITTYKKCVEFNTIFRNIKENTNLDYLEESEDEEEFQDISVDKWIKNNVEKIYKCKFNNKFKLWEPIEITTQRVSKLEDVLRIETI